MTQSLLVATAMTLLVSAAPAAEIVLVHAGHLLAVPGERVQSQRTVVIRDGRVAEILRGYADAGDIGASAADAVTVHDLRDHFVLPGLIDGHVHLTHEQNPRGRLDRVELSDADYALMGAGYARKTLLAGFTTVRDVGARRRAAIFALRDAIERGDVIGPRVFASGSTISVTGGHGDGTQGYRDDVADLIAHTGICNGAGDCRRAVRDQVRSGADHIKLTATAGVLSNTDAGLEQQFTTDELEAVIATAHSMNRRVTAHAHGVQGINAALRAGVDSIEHGSYLDDESIRLFRKNGAYLVPTLLAGVTVAEWAADPDSFLLPPQRHKAAQVGPAMVAMARRAHAGGVQIAFGTDSGVSAHGENAREFLLLVEAGMTPAEAIYAATVAGAANLGQSDRLGTLEPGKHADLVAVDGDPTEDPRELLDVDFVMRAGVAYKVPHPVRAAP